MKVNFAIKDAEALVVQRAIDWAAEQNEENSQSLLDAVGPLEMLHGWQAANNYLSSEQLELMLFISQIRAEVVGAMATLELAVMAPNVSDEQCVQMAKMLQTAVEFFVNASVEV